MADVLHTCFADGCDRPVCALGLCTWHYQRQRAGKPFSTNCEFCGAYTTRPRFCSQVCSQKLREIRLYGRKPEERDCLECGVHFTAVDPRTRYCTTKCSRKVNNRRSTAMRRARLVQATREWFDPVQVLERDGWQCHICKRKTPRRLRGTTDPRAPELDHIVSLFAGGEHSPRNTACACRRCNLTKGKGTYGQLRLIA